MRPFVRIVSLLCSLYGRGALASSHHPASMRSSRTQRSLHANAPRKRFKVERAEVNSVGAIRTEALSSTAVQPSHHVVNVPQQRSETKQIEINRQSPSGSSAGAGATRPAASQPPQSAINASSMRSEARKSAVLSSWVVVVLFSDAAELVKTSGKSWLTRAFRNAVADALDVCRTSVAVVDAIVTDIDLSRDPTEGFEFLQHHGDSSSFFQRVQRLVRLSGPIEDDAQNLLTSEVKMKYDVRIFHEMRVDAGEVARRVGNLQVYNKFSHLNRLLSNAVASQMGLRYLRLVHLSDIGNAERVLLEEPPLPQNQITDCMEEGFLNDARRTHATVVFLSFVLVVLITCTGSAVFTMKVPSVVPSRLNPIIS